MADVTDSAAVLPPDDGIERGAMWVEEAIATHDIRAKRRARSKRPDLRTALRDLIHYLPCTRCGTGSDECGDWQLASRIEGLIRRYGVAAGLAELVRLSDEQAVAALQNKPVRKRWWR